MYPQKYVVFRGKGDKELYWTGNLGKGTLANEAPELAKTFDSAEEAYLTIRVLVKNGYLPQTWLDSRIGLRYVAHGGNIMFDCTVEGHKSSPGFKGQAPWQTTTSGG